MSGISETLRFYGWLSVAAGEFLVYYWPITLVVLGLGAVAITLHSPLHDPHFRRRLRLLAIPYIIPLAILLVGTLLRYELHGPPHPHWRKPPEWYGYALYSLVILHVGLLVGLLVAKGSRLRAAGVLLPSLWLSLCALLPAGFAIAGVGP